MYGPQRKVLACRSVTRKPPAANMSRRCRTRKNCTWPHSKFKNPTCSCWSEVCTGAAAPATDCGTAYGDQHWTDSSGPDETVTLDFGSKTVTLLSATFYPNFSGRFDLGVDGSNVLDEAFLASVVSFGSGFAGSQFSFGADTTFDRNDRFKLSSITVEIPNEVPVPGTLGLLGLGLMGLGIARRGK